MKKGLRTSVPSADPEAQKKNFKAFLAQSDAVVSADDIITLLVNKGSQILYNRYLRRRVPRRIADFLTEACEDLAQQHVFPYDINNPRNVQHQLHENEEPPQVVTDSFMTDTVTYIKNPQPPLSSRSTNTNKNLLLELTSKGFDSGSRNPGSSPSNRAPSRERRTELAKIMATETSLNESGMTGGRKSVTNNKGRDSIIKQQENNSRAKTPVQPVSRETKERAMRNTSSDTGKGVMIKDEGTVRSLSSAGRKEPVMTKKQAQNLQKKELYKEYTATVVALKDTQVGVDSLVRVDVNEDANRKAYFEALKKKQKDDEEEELKQRRLQIAKRQVQGLDRYTSSKPTYTYGYNAEIIKTKYNISPKKNELTVKPRVEVPAQPTITTQTRNSSTGNVIIREPTQKTEEEGHTSGRRMIRRRASLDKTNRFLDMLKGYGIKVELDEKTREPKITDDIIKQLEKKSKGKISDVFEPQPGVKFTEQIPIKGQERVKENGLFMTQYDTQTGFPRITKEMYKKVKEKNPIISKDRVEEEVSKHNISALAAQQNNYYPESRESLDNDYKPVSQNRNLPPSFRGAQKQQLKPISPKEDKKTKESGQPMFLTFAAGPSKPILGKPEPVKASSTVIEASRRTHNENRGVAEDRDQVIEPRATSVNPRSTERVKPKSQSITKRTWRLRSAQKRDRSLIMPRAKNDSFDMDGSHISGVGGKKVMDESIINVNKQDYLDLLDISR